MRKSVLFSIASLKICRVPNVMQTRRTHTMYAIMNNKLPKTDLLCFFFFRRKFCINSNFDVSPNSVNDCSFCVLRFSVDLFIYVLIFRRCWCRCCCCGICLPIQYTITHNTTHLFGFCVVLSWQLHLFFYAYCVFDSNPFTFTVCFRINSPRKVTYSSQWLACGRVQGNIAVHHTYEHHLLIVLLFGCFTKKKEYSHVSQQTHVFRCRQKANFLRKHDTEVCDFRVCALFSNESRCWWYEACIRTYSTIEVCLALSRWKP